MYIIAGLGNPGREYENTRHNTGFRVIDSFAKEYDISVTEKKFKGLIGKGTIDGTKVILVKPETYMNNSGECLREVTDYFKVDPEKELIVVYDDINLDVGSIRIREKGRPGGHNGVENIILHLGTEKFKRIRVGIGEKPAETDLVNWVLGRFSKEDSEALDGAVDMAKEALALMIKDETSEAMNKFNKKVSK